MQRSKTKGRSRKGKANGCWRRKLSDRRFNKRRSCSHRTMARAN